MAWEKRGNKQYYYRKRREGDRVISEYVGSDRDRRARATATLDLAYNLEDQKQHRALQKRPALTKKLKTYVTCWEMSFGGCSSLKATIPTKVNGGKNAMPNRIENLRKQYGSDVLKQFAELSKSIDAHNPSQEDIKALQQMLDEHPDLWRIAGDLAYNTASRIIDYYTSSLTIQMSLEYGLADLRLDLDYAAATPLEKMLIEQVLLCWLYLNTVQNRFFNALNNQSFFTDKAILPWEKRVTAAQQRYLRACESLTRIRKFARHTPALQLNIAANGGQQINQANDLAEPIAQPNGKH